MIELPEGDARHQGPSHLFSEHRGLTIVLVYTRS
jgi:hypothetical protein